MLCPHCFREVNRSGVCPFCGYDGAGQEKKYPLALRPGSILGGRYILGHVLGQGGFGITYIALDDRTKERVAIKEYLPTDYAGRAPGSPSVQVYSGDREEVFTYGRKKFLEEAKTLAAFNGSANIVYIYSYFEENGTAYLCMEYVDGLPLNRYMAAHGGRLSPAEADRLLLPLMAALETVHAGGVIHRDIAPDNILVREDGTVKLIDFGAARYSTGEKTQNLTVILKHGFAPKEQYMRRGRQGPWTDVYAMAATYYYAITGRVPTEAIDRMGADSLIPPSALGVRIGKEEEAVLLRALEIEASRRYQSMAAFRRALEAASQRPTTPPKRPWKLPLLIGLGVTLLLLFILPKLRSAGTPTAPAAATASPAPTAAHSVPQEENALAFTVYDDHAEVKAADKAITSAVIPAAYKGKPVTGIESRAFFRCGQLKNVTIPESVTRIGSEAFFNCEYLTELSIPEGVTEIEDYVFDGCTRLTSVTLPESVTSIGTSAFHSCSGLTGVTIPEGVTSIGDYAFDSCSGLTGVTIPQNVTSIGTCAFDGCYKLTDIAIPKSVTFIGSAVFEHCFALEHIYVTAGSYAAVFFADDPRLVIEGQTSAPAPSPSAAPFVSATSTPAPTTSTPAPATSQTITRGFRIPDNPLSPYGKALKKNLVDGVYYSDSEKVSVVSETYKTRKENGQYASWCRSMVQDDLIPGYRMELYFADGILFFAAADLYNRETGKYEGAVTLHYWGDQMVACRDMRGDNHDLSYAGTSVHDTVMAEFGDLFRLAQPYA